MEASKGSAGCPFLVRRSAPIFRSLHLISVTNENTVAAVETGSSGVRPPVERKLRSARLSKSIFLSDQTKHLEFTPEGEELLPFTPGQFISIQQVKPDGKTHTRAYSIASAPRNPATFDLCL